MMTSTDYEPRAWVGCLSCYNNGTLKGEWLDVNGLEDAETLKQVCTDPSHEELWVMDHENLATDGEMSPAEAAKRARAITELVADCDDWGLPVPVALDYLENHLGYTDPETWPRIGDEIAYTSADDETDYVCTILEGWMDYKKLPSWLEIDYSGTFDNLTSGLTVIRHEGTLYVFHY